MKNQVEDLISENDVLKTIENLYDLLTTKEQLGEKYQTIEDHLSDDVEFNLGLMQDSMLENDDVAQVLMRQGRIIVFIKVFRLAVNGVWKNLRLIEMSLGILANSACYEKHRDVLSEIPELRQYMFYILRERDTSILTECVRFIHRNMSSKEYNKFDEWKDTLMENKDLFLENVIDILVNCTNADLLSRMLSFLDNLLDIDEDLLELFSGFELIEAVLIPLKTFLDDGKFKNFKLIFRPLHLLHTLIVNRKLFTSLKFNTYDDITTVVLSFSHRCLTWRVLSHDNENHTYGDGFLSYGEAATVSILQIALCLLSDKNLKEVKEEKISKFEETIKLFAEQILDIKGILANIEINYEDDRPWSDVSNEPIEQSNNEVCTELMRIADSVLKCLKGKQNTRI